MTAAADPKTAGLTRLPKTVFAATFYEMVGQYGTHVDPPAHFDQKGITLDEIPLKQMILPLSSSTIPAIRPRTRATRSRWLI